MRTQHVIRVEWARPLPSNRRVYMLPICYQDIKHTFHVQTEVKLIDLSPDLIDWYIGTGEPFDKAGGYGTRGKGAILVDRIAGCPFSMMGLPLQKLHSELSRILG